MLPAQALSVSKVRWNGSCTPDFNQRGDCLWQGWVPFCWWCHELLLLWTGHYCFESFEISLKATTTLASSDEQPASRYVARASFWWYFFVLLFSFGGRDGEALGLLMPFAVKLLSSTDKASACCLQHYKLLCRLCGVRWAPCCVTVMVMTPICTKLESKKELIEHACGLFLPLAVVGKR